MSSNEVKLILSGREYYGWTNVQIKVTLESIVRQFNLGMTRKTSDQGDDLREIQVGEEAQILIGDDVVVTGFITEVEEEISATSHKISVSGSSKTIDLVDCTIPDGEPLSYKDQTIGQSLATIASYYDVKVVDKVKKGDRVSLEIDSNVKIKDALSKWMKAHNFLLTDGADGELVITYCGEGGNSEDSVVFGVNVLTSKRVNSGESVYSRYVLLGQSKNVLSESGSSSNQLFGLAEHKGGRYRVLVLKQGESATQAEMNNRIATFRDIAVAKSSALSYTLRGWRQSKGVLWQANSFVSVWDEKFGIAGDQYLIASVTFTLNGSGMTAKLDLRSPEAFLNLPEGESNELSKSLPKNVKVASAGWTQT